MKALIEKSINNGEIDLSKILRSAAGQWYVRSIIQMPLPEYDVVGGPIAAADLICAGIVCNKWFGVNDSGKIIGNLEPGQRVLVVEDVCTTSARLSKAIDALIEHGAIPVVAITIVDRPKYGGIKTIADKFNIPVHAYYTLGEA